MRAGDGGYLRKTASAGLHQLILQADEQAPGAPVLLLKPRKRFWESEVLLLRRTDVLDPQPAEVQQEEQGTAGGPGQTGRRLQQCGGNGQKDHSGHQTVGHQTARPNHVGASQTG